MINKKKKEITHCCEAMQEELSDERVFISYNSKIREYFINTVDISIIRQIYHCPWCGQKLPKSLRDEWFDLLEKEYNLDDPDSKEQKKLIPEEFKTDKWWKKRNL